MASVDWSPMKRVMHEIASVFTAMNLTVVVQEIDNGHVLRVVLRGEEIASITIRRTQGDVRMGEVRMGEVRMGEVPVLQISTVEVMESYRGKGVGQLLVVYALAFEKADDIHYSILDDDSDRSAALRGNIYASIGYEFVKPPTRTKRIDGVDVWELHGPERQLHLDEAFLKRVTDIVARRKSTHVTFGKRSKSKRSKSKKYF